MEELAGADAGAQKVAWADNAIKLAVEMTVAAINSLELSGSSDEQAVQVRDAIRIVFPEAVTLVREAREGLSASSRWSSGPAGTLGQQHGAGHRRLVRDRRRDRRRARRARLRASILVARREERLRSLATELSSEHGVEAEVIACDLGRGRASVTASSREMSGRARPVEVLVNNAGFGAPGDFADASARERMLEMVRLNVEAVVDLTSRFLPAMVERGRGRDHQHRLDGRVPAAAGLGGLRGEQGLRPLLQRGDPDRAARHGRHGHGRLPRARCRPSSSTVAGVPGSRSGRPASIWMAAEEIARQAVERRRARQARGRPGHAQPRRSARRPAQPQGAGAAADRPDLAQAI